MKRKLFLRILACALIVFIACFSVTLSALQTYLDGQVQKQLEQEGKYLSRAVEEYGVDFLQGTDKDKYHRVTWIAEDGTVLYDSQVDAATMENHNQRQEVLQARERGWGMTSRYSDTLSTNTLNYALLLEDGTVLRLSNTVATAVNLVWDLRWEIGIIMLLALALSLGLAWTRSIRLVRPLDTIDLDHPDDGKIYPELRPLVQRINAQNRQLQHQMDLLIHEHERQDRLQREFTANVSHELKTPLTSISGYAEIIREDIARPEDVKRFAGTIYDEAQRLQRLVGDIIQLSQLEDYNAQLDQEPVDLYQLSVDVLQRLRPQAGRMDVDLELRGERLIVRCSQRLVREIILNLCDNAIKYNRRGGSVRVLLDRMGGLTRLTVSDTGIGIPKEDQSRVFERFYRVDKSHSKSIGGTGLGLSIVKNAAARQKIEIRLSSELGVGTEVELLFRGEQEDG